MTTDVAAPALDALARPMTCRIATRGRRSGVDHVVSVWFVLVGTALHVAARHGERSDWLRNALAAGSAEVRIRRRCWPAVPSVVRDDALIATVLDAFGVKYATHATIVAAWRLAPPVFVALDLAPPARVRSGP